MSKVRERRRATIRSDYECRLAASRRLVAVEEPSCISPWKAPPRRLPRTIDMTDPVALPEDLEQARRVAKLSDGQRICLSLVAQHLSSKEIAQQLGISAHTLDQRMRFALPTLKVTDRKDAALLLLRHETCQPRPPRMPFATSEDKNRLTLGWRFAWIVVIQLGQPSLRDS